MMKHLSLVLMTVAIFGCSTQPKKFKPTTLHTTVVDNTDKQIAIKEAFVKENESTNTKIDPRKKLKYIEASLRSITESYVYQANDNLTWISIENTISKFLNDQWKDGLIVGATQQDAYTIEVGLGKTMIAQDVINGIIVVRVQVAVETPRVFSPITIQQQLQSY